MSCPRIGSIDKQNSKMQNHLHFGKTVSFRYICFTILFYNCNQKPSTIHRRLKIEHHEGYVVHQQYTDD